MPNYIKYFDVWKWFNVLLFHLNTKWVKEVSKIFNVYLNNCQNASEVQMQETIL